MIRENGTIIEEVLEGRDVISCLNPPVRFITPAASGEKRSFSIFVLLLPVFLLAIGCAHYPVNKAMDRYTPDSGYRGKYMATPEDSEDIALFLAFSGGGTRAAALSYGLLEKLRDKEVIINGKERRLLDEVEAISGVSGGSFTAGYYGLFGNRIFEDFESRFLKKNIQGALVRSQFFNPYNWIRLMSPSFGRSDMSAEYYDKHVFDRGTFGDIAAQGGPMILINATDMISGVRIAFNQNEFDIICSDLSSFPVSRAAAASSAVPGVLTPITLRNYAGTCGFIFPEEAEKVLLERDTTKRQFHQLNNIKPYLDSKKIKYIHLVDGGVADNLGLRAALDNVLAFGSFWETLKRGGGENIHKLVFIVVNAETEVSNKLSLVDKTPGLAAMISSYSSIAITRYNYETVMLLRESFSGWKREVQEGRCGNGPISTEPGSCGDIEFYLIEVKFNALKDEDESTYFKSLPTSFKLSSEEVDRLREVAGRLLVESPEFQRLLRDLK
jgi:NTE family protein